MSMLIRQSELRNDNSGIMRRVAQGESFVVTVHGRPVADVVPHRQDTGKRRFAAVSELAKAFASDPTPDPRAWQADIDEAGELFGADQPSDPFEREAR